MKVSITVTVKVASDGLIDAVMHALSQHGDVRVYGNAGLVVFARKVTGTTLESTVTQAMFSVRTLLETAGIDSTRVELTGVEAKKVKA